MIPNDVFTSRCRRRNSLRFVYISYIHAREPSRARARQIYQLLKRFCNRKKFARTAPRCETLSTALSSSHQHAPGPFAKAQLRSALALAPRARATASGYFQFNDVLFAGGVYSRAMLTRLRKLTRNAYAKLGDAFDIASRTVTRRSIIRIFPRARASVERWITMMAHPFYEVVARAVIETVIGRVGLIAALWEVLYFARLMADKFQCCTTGILWLHLNVLWNSNETWCCF